MPKPGVENSRTWGPSDGLQQKWEMCVGPSVACLCSVVMGETSVPSVFANLTILPRAGAGVGHLHALQQETRAGRSSEAGASERA
jgi:hypothetical protein